MNLLIDGEIVLPPTEISCFRDVTLYGSVFADFNILIEDTTNHKDILWAWLKSHGAHDFVDYIIGEYETEHGVILSNRRGCNICVSAINADNLSFIISRLKQYALQSAF